MMTEKTLFGIYGASGCGRGVLPVALEMLRGGYADRAYEVVFVDDHVSTSLVNGRRVLRYREFLEEKASARYVSIAIADPRTRRRLHERCLADGLASFSVRASSVVSMDDVEIGEGAILSPFVTLTSNIQIGRQFHCNLYSYVEHDCSIGDYVTFAPSVRCNGNVRIEDHAYLGAGCVIRQGTPSAPLVIGQGAIVGMGAVVIRNVPAGVTVVGNPARELNRRSSNNA